MINCMNEMFEITKKEKYQKQKKGRTEPKERIQNRHYINNVAIECHCANIIFYYLVVLVYNLI